jgi:hypothetical protein
VLDGISRDIPPEWYEDDYHSLPRLLEHIFRRGTRVPELLLEAKKSNRQPFPNWGEMACTSHVLRYTPNLVRDEWVNIGILLFNSATGERRLRLIEDEEEYRRLRRLHPQADEALLRAYATIWKSACKAPKHLPLPAICLPGMAAAVSQMGSHLVKRLAVGFSKGRVATDLDAELERLYSDHIAVQYSPGRVGAPGSRARVRSYCLQVFRQAHLWERIEKSVRWRNGLLPATRCALITATAATARAVSCTPSR